MSGPLDGVRILDSTDALALDSLPERIAVVGGGYIGVELGTALAKAGASVTDSCKAFQTSGSGGVKNNMDSKPYNSARAFSSSRAELPGSLDFVFIVRSVEVDHSAIAAHFQALDGAALEHRVPLQTLEHGSAHMDSSVQSATFSFPMTFLEIRWWNI